MSVTGDVLAGGKIPSGLLLAGLALTTAVALVDWLAGPRLVILGLLLAGPLLVAAGHGPAPTALVGSYAVALALLLGAENRIWGTGDHLVRMTVVAVNGAVVTWLAAVRQRAQRQHARATAILENTEDAVVVKSLDGTVLDWNPGAQKLYGYHAREVVGQRAMETVVPRDREPELLRVLETIRNGGHVRPFETERLRKNGERITVSTTFSPIKDAVGRITSVSVISRDISVSVRLAEEYRRTVEKLRAILDASPVAILSVDQDDRVLSWNLAATRMFGWTAEEVVGGSLPIVPATEQSERARMRQLLQGGHEIRGYETVRQRKDGSLLTVSVSAAPLRDSTGAVAGSIRILEDLTERRSLQEQLERSQRLEAVGQLAAGVAHDFNNLLTGIIGYGGLLLRGLPEGSLSRERAEEIVKAGERAARLTQQLLAFSRKQVLDPRVVDLNLLVADLEKMLRRLLPESVLLETRLDPKLGTVRVDAGRMEQVILNLVVNARDAMPDGGTLTIETENVDLDTHYARLHQWVRPGPHVLVAVTDTGTGMDPDTLARAFEPFFTTKEHGKGTGLGLSTAYGIVKQSGGHIWAYSEVGRGSVFKVYLPRTEAAAEGVPSRHEAREIPTGTETILLAEDEDLVRELARDFLESAGYRVLPSRGSEEAWQLLLDYRDPIHLLVTDVVMGGMSGRDLAERLPKERGIRVLYLSGYPNDTIARHGVLEPGVNFLQKPFSREALLRKVREVLDGPR